MRRILLLIALVIATPSLFPLGQTPDKKSEKDLPPSAGAAQNMTVKQAVAELERESATASMRRDLEKLQHFFADGYVHTDSRGEVTAKVEALSNLKSGDLTYESIDLDLVEVHVFADTAVLTARATVKGRFRGQNFGGLYRLTRVYVKLQGRWQAVAGHSSLIPQP